MYGLPSRGTFTRLYTSLSAGLAQKMDFRCRPSGEQQQQDMLTVVEFDDDWRLAGNFP